MTALDYIVKLQDLKKTLHVLEFSAKSFKFKAKGFEEAYVGLDKIERKLWALMNIAKKNYKFERLEADKRPFVIKNRENFLSHVSKVKAEIEGIIKKETNVNVVYTKNNEKFDITKSKHMDVYRGIVTFINDILKQK